MNQSLKKYFTNFYASKEKKNRLVLIVIGLASTLWFLIRVIPKPTRASYPCMRAAAPMMTTFIVWLAGSITSIYVFRKANRLFRKSRYVLAALLVFSGLFFAFFTFSSVTESANAEAMFSEESDYPSNEPMGEGLELFPGRVVWTHNPDATDENSSITVNGDGYIDEDDDVFFLRHNNDEAVIKEMLSFSIARLAGTDDLSQAWDQLFHFHNNRKYGDDQGYQDDETIYIKTNFQGVGLSHTMSSDLRQEDKTVWGSFPPHMTATSPYPILATVEQLVTYGGVPEEMIFIGDPHNNINNIYYDIITEQFPDVNIIGVNSNDVYNCELHGRTLSIPSSVETVFFSDRGSVLDVTADKLYQQLEDADYIINIAALKSHIRGGVTLFCKSHFGSHTRPNATHMHPGLPYPQDGVTNFGYGKYRVLVDLMGNKYLGGNTMLYILDGLWGGKPHELHEPRKWDMEPFSGDWTSSVFMSVDPVAIASVAFDFLRTEYNETDWGNEAYPNYYGTDDYLHQAADPANWPEGIEYDPENDGTPLTSLGVHEHWNNATDKQYSRNLDPESGTGIELLSFTREDMQTFGIPEDKTLEGISIYPVPVKTSVQINIPLQISGKDLFLQIYDMAGRVQLSARLESSQIQELNLSQLKPGNYILNIKSPEGFYNQNIVKE